MSTPHTPFPSLAKLEKVSMKNKRFREPMRNIIEALLDSYKTGHKGWTKLAAYTRIQKELPYLDRALVDIFNDLTYRQRPALDSTPKNVTAVKKVTTP